MINLFCGYDKREAFGWHLFVQSVLDRTSEPVAIHRLDSCGMQHGSNAFTMSRFFVAQMMGYKGHAIFADASDMLCLGNIAELDAMFDPRYAVQVVKHYYMTRNPIKYIGTKMECQNLDYPKKNWASLMLINCEHPAWQQFHPEMDRMIALQFVLFNDAQIGELPSEWNRLVDEGQKVEGAKILHFTAGLPMFPHYEHAPGAGYWHTAAVELMRGE
jgi:hypothetical protein